MPLKNLAWLACFIAIAILLPFGLLSAVETSEEERVSIQPAGLGAAPGGVNVSDRRVPAEAKADLEELSEPERAQRRIREFAEAIIREEGMEHVERPQLQFLQPRGIGVEELEPRRPRAKRPVESIRRIPGMTNDQLIVKFKDDVQARLAPAERGQVRSRGGRQVDTFADIVEEFDLRLRPLINMSEEELRSLERRAELMSGRAQPDLAGMFFIDGPVDLLEHAARKIHFLDEVEYVLFDPKVDIYRMPGGDPTAACCRPNGNCQEDVTEAQCDDLNGTWLDGIVSCAGSPCDQGACCDGGACDETLRGLCDLAGGDFGNNLQCGPGACDPGACCVLTDCIAAANQALCQAAGGVHLPGGACPADPADDDPCEELECGEPAGGDCFIPNPTPYCADEDCCETVCEIFPFCCIEAFGEWNPVCVSVANCFCETDIGANRCACPFTGSCFEPNGIGGCEDPECCNAVCAIEETCCTGPWGLDCATIALSLDDCLLDDSGEGATPNLASAQGYRTFGPYTGDEDTYDSLLTPTVEGRTGEGWFLEDNIDVNDPFAIGNPYAGLYGLGRFLIDDFGIGADVEEFHPVYGGVRGATVNVAVIEWAYYEGHEDLDVIKEPGQTLILLPADPFGGGGTEPNHGTASLGVIGARETDPPTGLIGVAPDAQLWFFPITSIEEGPRPFTAIASAISFLEAGDIISHSWGPGPNLGNLNNSQPYWDLFALATDTGISNFIAAGNSCFDLGAAPNEGDSGATVVGAVTPGYDPEGSFLYRRAAFSNFSSNQAALPAYNENSNVVHVAGWGQGVASTGYGGLFSPAGNPNRAYTPTYGGTSAATPMVAALAACYQGFAKQFYGIPLTPQDIRALLQAGPYGQPLGAAEIIDSFACAPDLDTTNQQTNRVIGSPRARLGAAFMLTQNLTPGSGFDIPDTNPITNVWTIRGRHLFGNLFSVKQPGDNLFYFAESQFTRPNDKPAFIPPAYESEVGKIRYRTTGQITDVLAEATFNNPQQVDAFTVTAFGAPVASPSVSFLEAYDWVQGRWQFIGFNFNAAGAGLAVESDPVLTFDPTRFVNQETGKALARVWTQGFTQLQSSSPNALPNTYIKRVDAILFNQDVTQIPTPIQ